jgi:hypothetical protein
MKTNILIRVLTLSLAGFVFFLPGCRNYLVPEQGALSQENARIDFSKDGETLWKGKEMDIKYSISQKNDGLIISGTVIIHDSILMSFDRLEQLAVKLNLLDELGRVIGTVDITPPYATYNSVAGPMVFKTAVASVSGASSFAFSYLGTLFGGRLSETSDSWEIFYFPFVDER